MLSWLMAAVVVGLPSRPPESGVSSGLAASRAAAIGSLRYDVRFRVPAAKSAPIDGRVTARFTLTTPTTITLDFAQPPDRIRAVRVADRPVEYRAVNGHIEIPAAVTHAGDNAITVDFVAGDEPFNRSDDYLYTLFVPARAHAAFPCFDQPDLKARYTLAVTAPTGWQVVANGAAVDGGTASDEPGMTVHRFAETQPLPTYLFSLVAGRFSVEAAERRGRTFRMLHRETDAAKVARNRDAIFDLHSAALEWLESYTQIPYPFGKFDVVLIPSFQFGGMEHAGAILYNAAGLMLDASATQNQLLGRASVIAHETAHMWFGDLVTMRWFNDVWTKEVFANFMASKIVNPSFPSVNHDLRFLLEHYPAAYQVDRTAGTNAVRQRLDNLRDAGQMYGPIIYDKAPIVMRQLEWLVGEDAFRDGLREYLRRFAFGNATWLDLVSILDARTPLDVRAWSRAWVEERGRPRFRTTTAVDSTGRVTRLTLTQRDALGRGLLWPQRLTLTLGLDDGTTTHLDVNVAGGRTQVPAANGLRRPRYVLPNGGGRGYGYFELDEASRRHFLDHIETVSDPLTRGSAWVTLWDNMLEGRVPASALVDTALRALPLETDEQNAQRVLAYTVRAAWKFLSDAERVARGPRLEAAFRAGLERAPTQSQKAAWFNAYRDTVMSPVGLAWLERVWRREERVPGLALAEQDEITLALELAVREVPGWEEVLTTQLQRTENPDRKARFAFVMPSLSADPVVRERAFERFLHVENRRREAWVLESMQYLNHPLRAAHAARFVPRALALLRDIQRTGDIFFPTRWADAALSGHRSPQVARVVRAFLRDRPRFPTRLRWTLLSAADDLFRAARLRASPTATP